MAKMRAVQVARANGPLEVVQRDIPEPGPGAVRVKVQACGVCHSDVMVRTGDFPGLQYPRVPGHEVVGMVDAVGPGVSGWKVGQRVGVGWQGGYCGYCDSCRRGEFIVCETVTRVTGFTYDGGYADYMLAWTSALARVPDDLSPIDAAPLMCAGVTTYNALRNAGARPGDLIAVLGLGGLGHLGVQYAARMGFNTVAIARGRDKEGLARELGARTYIDNQAQNPADALRKLGGAKAILATAPNSEAMSAVIPGLRVDGVLLVIAVSGAMQVSPADLIAARRVVQGSYSGTSIDAQDTLAFSMLSGVRSRNEVFPLERAGEAYDRMLSGKARFRVVLTTGL